MPRSRRGRKRQPEAPQPPPPPAPSRLRLIAVPAAVFLLLLLIYLATLLPTMVDQDSGELVAAVHVQGIAHPTGYPLWLLLGRAFDYLPVGHTSAYRVGLLSSASTAAAGGLVTLFALIVTGQLLPAALAGISFGLWFPCWSQAVRAEVYGLTALLFAFALLGFARWHRDRSPRALLWFALACGFVSMHHRTALLAAMPSFAVAAFLTRPRRTRALLAAAAAFVAPFLLYLYLPIRALARPPVNWTDPSTLPRFLDHVLASQYAHFAFSHSLDQMVEQGAALLPELLAPAVAWSLLLTALALPLACWGWEAWRKREPLVAWSLAAGSALLVVWVLQWGETSDLKVFLSPLGAVLAISGAMGMAQLGNLLPRPALRCGVLAVLGLALCGIQLGANWARADLSNRWEHRDRWAAVLSQLEPNAVFISDFDVPSFGTIYLQNVEDMRRDVALLRAVRLSDAWYLDLIEDAVLRQATTECWQQAQRGARDLREQTALFAFLLAKRLPERAIYAVHGPMQIPLPGPPYFVALSEDVVHLAHVPPDIERQQEPGRPLAEFPAGMSLLAFAADRPEAATGSMVGFTTQWRLAAPLPTAQFAIGLIPPSMSLDRFSPARWEDERLVQAFPVVHGLWGTGPSPPGTIYEQRGRFIVPTNAAPGRYRLAIGIAPLYSMAYQAWIEVGEIEIRAHPRPRNPA